MRSHTKLRAGDWVEIRGREEILLTLDRSGKLEGMPFMPEMLRFCGQRHRIYKRAHRTCDTVDYIGGRHLDGTVHLEGLRCDGEEHGGCQALCLLFWKEAWLRKVSGPDSAARSPGATPAAASPADGTPDVLAMGTRKEGEAPNCPDPTYVCQGGEMIIYRCSYCGDELDPGYVPMVDGDGKPQPPICPRCFWLDRDET